MRRPFNGTFPVTQIFGVNPESYVQFGYKGHNGYDYGLPLNTPIVAPHEGKIIEAAFDQSGYGMYVKIENDVEGSVLGHMTSFNVNPGDTILEGQQIGLSGNTGNSTGPHLHWGYYRMPRDRQNGYGGFIDQSPYLNSTPVQNDALSECLRQHEDLVKQVDDQKKANADLLIVNKQLNADIANLKKELSEQKEVVNALQTETDTKIALAVKDCQAKCDKTIENYKSKLKQTNKGLLVLILDKLGL